VTGVVVVTGASAGVGRAVSRAFAARGTAVALLARGSTRLDEARREVEVLGARALSVPLDVADAHAVAEAAARVETELGPIDVWVNNAVASVLAPLQRVTPEEFRRVTEVTYLGSVWGTMAALERMRPRDRGVVVQVGSALAYRGIPLQSAYCGSKHALQGFLESVRTELRHDGSAVRLAMVQLPAVNTPQFEWMRSRMPMRARPVPPVYSPELAAAAVLAAADRPSRDVLVGWPTVRAILGNAVVPWYVDRKLVSAGYDGQQTDELETPTRPDNLFDPVALDVAADGRFGHEERRRGLRVSGDVARAAGALGLASVVAALAAARRQRLSR
jgi:NAD(P)-dependent dehydrogenase (short-subunit alcohol dehydrogenase family)